MDWHQAFFGGLALDLWRQAAKPELTEAEADFIADELRAEGGMHLLDVPCGNGRHALELARRGCRVTGVDDSAEYIAEAKALAAAPADSSALPVAFHRAEMRQLPWTDAFDGAYCLGNSFGYLDAAGSADFLAALSASLRPGARFVLDSSLTAESVLPHLEDRVWRPVEDILLLAEYHYLAEESRLQIDYTFVRGGERETRRAEHWVFTVAEVRRMLAAAGLTTLALYADTEHTPFEVGAERLLLVAEKAR